MKTAFILIDYINEIVHEEGKLAQKGYSQFIEQHNTFKHLSSALTNARRENMLIIHVKVGFSKSYIEQPKQSPLFSKAQEFEALQLDTFATEFHKAIDVKENDIIITKHRVNAFYQTPFDLILKNNNIQHLIIGGVATDLAVSNTVRDAHDRDYHVTILSDCCAAANEEDHNTSLQLLQKIAIVQTNEEFFK
ncbi:MAG: cysteine hydrolase family protein [Candidatus Nanoarchaeia archaeon]